MSSVRVLWKVEADKGSYYSEGFVDKDRFSIKLPLDEARWIRHNLPIILKKPC